MAVTKTKDSTPFVETNAQGLTITSFTQFQNKLLLRIISCTQRDIRDAITQQTNDKTYNPVFKAEEIASGYRTVRIPMSKLEPRQGHRQRAKIALLEMTGKHVYIPFLKGRKVVDYAGFRSFFVVNFEYKANQTIAAISFPIMILKYYLSIDLGYHYLDFKQLECFTHNCARQMYRVYKSYFALGKNSFSPIRLAITLSPKNSFKSYSAMSREVFNIAKKEMDILYKNGLCDIHFDYRATVPKNDCLDEGRKKVICTFYTRQDETLTDSRKDELEAYQARIFFTLKNNFGVNEGTARDLGKQVKIWMEAELDVLMEHKMWFAKKMEAKGNKQFNKAGYIVKAMKKFFCEMNQKRSDSEGKNAIGNDKGGDAQAGTTPIDTTGQYYLNKNE